MPPSPVMVKRVDALAAAAAAVGRSGGLMDRSARGRPNPGRTGGPGAGPNPGLTGGPGAEPNPGLTGGPGAGAGAGAGAGPSRVTV